MLQDERRIDRVCEAVEVGVCAGWAWQRRNEARVALEHERGVDAVDATAATGVTYGR